MKKYIKPELIIVETETQNLMAGSVVFDKKELLPKFLHLIMESLMMIYTNKR